MLDYQGHVEEALTVLRDAFNNGDTRAAEDLGEILISHERIDEAISALSHPHLRSNPYVTQMLLEQLKRGHRENDLRALASADDDSLASRATGCLADLYVSEDREEDLLALIDDQHHGLISVNFRYQVPEMPLAELYLRQERETDLREMIHAGFSFAADSLVDLLVKMGRKDEADQVRRYGLNADGSTAAGEGKSTSHGIKIFPRFVIHQSTEEFRFPALDRSAFSYGKPGEDARPGRSSLATTVKGRSGVPIYGIDLGTTYCCVAKIDDTGRAVILPNAVGEDTTPSVVYFESADEVLVGRVAKDSALLAPDLIAQLVKRDMGSDDVHWTYHGQRHTPESVSGDHPQGTGPARRAKRAASRYTT